MSGMTEQRGCSRFDLERDLQRIAEGDKQALAHFYEQTRSAVFAYALAMVKNPHDAEDVAQQTYLRIWKAAGSYRPQGKPMAWLTVTVHRLALDFLRGQKHLTDLPEEDWNAVPAEQGSISEEDRLTLQAVMQRLNDQEREIVVLHAVVGFRHREIASQMKLPLSTVLSKYNRALKKLKTAWEEEHHA